MTFNQSGNRIAEIIFIFSVLAGAWLAWSGLYKPLLLSLGAFSCFLTFLLIRRMGYLNDVLISPLFLARLPAYWLWLGGQIIKSTLDVTKIILDPKMPISPRVIDIEVSSIIPLDQATLGNSITLTPGTLTLDLYRGVIKVHTLTEAGAKDLLNGDMARRVSELRRK